VCSTGSALLHGLVFSLLRGLEGSPGDGSRVESARSSSSNPPGLEQLLQPADHTIAKQHLFHRPKQDV
jgi:hypothetical protein